MIEKELRIVILEDQVIKAAEMQTELRNVLINSEIAVAETQFSFRHALKTFVPHIVFISHDTAHISVSKAIQAVRDIYKNLPIITFTNDSKEPAILKDDEVIALLEKSDIESLDEKLEPLLHKVIKNNKRTFEKIKKKRKKNDRVRRVHSILKSSTHLKKADSKKRNYYDKLIKEISDNLPNSF